MKVLFLLHYPGYVRYFNSVFAAILARGHSLHLSFNGNWKQTDGLAVLPDHPELVVDFEDFPKRLDSAGLAKQIRGTVDYVRYLDKRFKATPWLRERTEGALPDGMRFLTRSPPLPTPVVKAARRFMVRMERWMIPSSGDIEDYIADVGPDILVVSPLVNVRSWQTDAVKSAKALGIPTAVCIASWDHLTTKGLIRIRPDKVFVWNPIQKKEAWELHDIPGDAVVVTGAQPFDKWFDRRPSTSRDEFLAKVGLPPGRPFVLFVGSTSSISKPELEVEFVRRWIAKLRASDGPLRDISVLVRPHPFNSKLWKDTVLDDAATAVYPRAGANPVDEGDRADYFDSIHHSAAVLGINTSAMVEATILGRPVLSILDSDFETTQEGTIHFQYLLPQNGGFLEVARSLDEHVAQLERVIADPEPYRQRVSGFVDRFVRPLGRDQNATEKLVLELETLASRQLQRQSAPRPALAASAEEAKRVARAADG